MLKLSKLTRPIFTRLFLLLPILVMLSIAFQNCSKGFESDYLNNSSPSTNSQTANDSSPESINNENPLTASTIGCESSSGIAMNFSCSMYFNQSVESLVLNQAQKNYSDHLINGLVARGGWGNSNVMQTDFSIDVLEASGNTTSFFDFDPTDSWTDSDSFEKIPSPGKGSSAGFESSTGTDCDGGDCHYLVLDKPNKKLYEVFRAQVNGNTLANAGDGGAVIWPFEKTWTESLRGDVCTSADASGLSIGSMLFSAEEIKAGAINHAIRFILPNDRIAFRTYVRPATHTTGNVSGWALAPTTNLYEAPLANSAAEPGLPYGTRLRLKSQVNISNLSVGAQVVAKALKKYGMILADGGNIALTAKSDAHSAVKYADVGFNARSLASLKVSDFEVVPPAQPKPFASGLSFQPVIIGPMIKVKYLDCYRNTQ